MPNIKTRLARLTRAVSTDSGPSPAEIAASLAAKLSGAGVSETAEEAAARGYHSRADELAAREGMTREALRAALVAAASPIREITL